MIKASLQLQGYLRNQNYNCANFGERRHRLLVELVKKGYCVETLNRCSGPSERSSESFHFWLARIRRSVALLQNGNRKFKNSKLVVVAVFHFVFPKLRLKESLENSFLCIIFRSNT